MTTDPAVTVVVLSVAFLAFCAIGACVQHYLDWRDRTNERRDERLRQRRCWQLIDKLDAYGYHLNDQAPDYLPDWMEREAA